MNQEQNKEKYWKAYYDYLEECDNIINNISYDRVWDDFNLYSLKTN